MWSTVAALRQRVMSDIPMAKAPGQVLMVVAESAKGKGGNQKRALWDLFWAFSQVGEVIWGQYDTTQDGKPSFLMQFSTPEQAAYARSIFNMMQLPLYGWGDARGCVVAVTPSQMLNVPRKSRKTVSFVQVNDELRSSTSGTFLDFLWGRHVSGRGVLHGCDQPALGQLPPFHVYPPDCVAHLTNLSPVRDLARRLCDHFERVGPVVLVRLNRAEGGGQPRTGWVQFAGRELLESALASRAPRLDGAKVHVHRADIPDATWWVGSTISDEERFCWGSAVQHRRNSVTWGPALSPGVGGCSTVVSTATPLSRAHPHAPATYAAPPPQPLCQPTVPAGPFYAPPLPGYPWAAHPGPAYHLSEGPCMGPHPTHLAVPAPGWGMAAETPHGPHPHPGHPGWAMQPMFPMGAQGDFYPAVPAPHEAYSPPPPEAHSPEEYSREALSPPTPEAHSTPARGTRDADRDGSSSQWGTPRSRISLGASATYTHQPYPPDFATACSGSSG